MWIILNVDILHCSIWIDRFSAVRFAECVDILVMSTMLVCDNLIPSLTYVCSVNFPHYFISIYNRSWRRSQATSAVLAARAIDGRELCRHHVIDEYEN